MNKSLYSKQVKLKDVKICDDFWSPIQKTVRDRVIPYQFEALNDRIDGAAKSYAIENFKKASSIIKNGQTKTFPVDKWCYDLQNSDEAAFHGWVFQDSDVYKWLEAVAYSLTNCWDEALYKEACETIDLVCSAQMENGYLDTLYIINNQNEIFTNLRDFHELYCFGHLAEAGVAFFNATGNDKLLKATCKFADLICATFGKGKKEGYGGHEIAELALVKLYNVTNNQAYLDMAEFFINQRGQKPYYFDTERGEEHDGERHHYNQAHKPPRQQDEAVGHAVRGVYLYSGMADVAMLKEDDELYSACQALWNNITTKKMYITGGIGSTVHGEAFTQNYDLPNDLAYCETCASIGLMFFGMRMLKIKPDCQVADVMERALYNTILASMNTDGDRFFYVNPLEVLPSLCHSDERKWHVKPERQKWFGCACCPPNLARLLSSVGEYCFTQTENTLYVHQYIGCNAKTDFGTVDISSTYYKNGSAKLDITPSKPFTLALRIPSWCKEYYIDTRFEVKDGYVYISVDKATTIKATFFMLPRLVKCSNLVRENVGKVALCHGPFVYCVESVDNGENLQSLIIDKNTLFLIEDGIVCDGFREKPDTELYSAFKDYTLDSTKIRFIPYYRWGNRGETEMQVYIRV